MSDISHVISGTLLLKICDFRRKGTLFNGQLSTRSYPWICGKCTGRHSKVYFMLLLILSQESMWSISKWPNLKAISFGCNKFMVNNYMLKLAEEWKYFTFIFEKKQNKRFVPDFCFPRAPILAWQKEFNLTFDTTIFVLHFIRGQKTILEPRRPLRKWKIKIYK